MATASSHVTEIDRVKSLHVRVEVGAATWHVVLSADAVAALSRIDDAPATPMLSARATDRLMDTVRAKAIRLHWYGGGTMTIDASDLAPVMADDDRAPARWYRVTETHAPGGWPERLRSVS